MTGRVLGASSDGGPVGGDPAGGDPAGEGELGSCWRLRLPLELFAAFAATVPGVVLPQAFRPAPGAEALIRDAAVRRGLAVRGLLLRDGPRVVLCPQLSGLLRLFADAATRVELRVHDAATPDGPTWWSTAAVTGRGLGVRLARAQVRTADGLRDADVVDVAGFPASVLAVQVAAVVPAGRGSRTTGSHSTDSKPIDSKPIDSVGAVRSLWLALHTAGGSAVDTWWDDGGGWRRVRPDGHGGSTQVRVDTDRLRHDLVDHLAGAVTRAGESR